MINNCHDLVKKKNSLLSIRTRSGCGSYFPYLRVPARLIHADRRDIQQLGMSCDILFFLTHNSPSVTFNPFQSEFSSKIDIGLIKLNGGIWTSKSGFFCRRGKKEGLS